MDATPLVFFTLGLVAAHVLKLVAEYGYDRAARRMPPPVTGEAAPPVIDARDPMGSALAQAPDLFAYHRQRAKVQEEWLATRCRHPGPPDNGGICLLPLGHELGGDADYHQNTAGRWPVAS